MALIVKNIPNKIPVKQVKGRDPRPKSREFMPSWTKWRDETISRLKAEKAAEAEDGRRAAK